MYLRKTIVYLLESHMAGPIARLVFDYAMPTSWCYLPELGAFMCEESGDDYCYDHYVLYSAFGRAKAEILETYHFSMWRIYGRGHDNFSIKIHAIGDPDKCAYCGESTGHRRGLCTIMYGRRKRCLSVCGICFSPSMLMWHSHPFAREANFLRVKARIDDSEMGPRFDISHMGCAADQSTSSSYKCRCSPVDPSWSQSPTHATRTEPAPKVVRTIAPIPGLGPSVFYVGGEARVM
jgi:hypothetical protein